MTGSLDSSRPPARRSNPAPFYDDFMGVSSKTTFEAVTHALLRIQLDRRRGREPRRRAVTRGAGRVVRGEVIGAPGDHQFRMYVRLTAGARETLARSQQFKRGADNSVYHKGYPTNYREQGGVPSVQISIALDGRRADIDVDYRASSFPTALVQRPSHVVQFRRSCRKQLRPPHQPVDRLPEMVGRLFRGPSDRRRDARRLCPPVRHSRRRLASARRTSMRWSMTS